MLDFNISIKHLTEIGRMGSKRSRRHHCVIDEWACQSAFGEVGAAVEERNSLSW